MNFSFRLFKFKIQDIYSYRDKYIYNKYGVILNK